MALSNAIAAYADCDEYYQRAQDSPKGIRILCPSKNDAEMLRFRLNKLRCLERQESCKIYDRFHHQHNKSLNDKFRNTVKASAEGDGSYWVYIEPWNDLTLPLEELE